MTEHHGQYSKKIIFRIPTNLRVILFLTLLCVIAYILSIGQAKEEGILNYNNGWILVSKEDNYNLRIDNLSTEFEFLLGEKVVVWGYWSDNKTISVSHIAKYLWE